MLYLVMIMIFTLFKMVGKIDRLKSPTCKISKISLQAKKDFICLDTV